MSWLSKHLGRVSGHLAVGSNGLKTSRKELDILTGALHGLCAFHQQFSLIFACREPSNYVQAGSRVNQNSCDLRCFDDGGTATWEGGLVEAMSQHGGDVELQIAALEVWENVLRDGVVVLRTKIKMTSD